MNTLDCYKVDLKGISAGETTSFHWHVEEDFFTVVQGTEITRGSLDVDLEVRQRAEAYELSFHIEGEVAVLCDRCLEFMDIPIDADILLKAKFGDEYDDDGDCYWFGISHGYDYARYDTALKKYTEYRGFNNGFTKQGMDADDKYVYFVLYKTNCIAVYTKDGEYVRQIDLPVTAGEPENISHVGDVFYIVYNNPSWTGGIVYETVITEKK
mgnify:CR=1 FL=1